MSHNIANRRLFSLAIAGILFLQGCAGTKKSASRHGTITSPMQTPVEGGSSTEAKEYKEMEALYQADALEGMRQKLVSFVKRFPKSSYLPPAENLYGLLLLKHKKALDSIYNFKKAISLNPSNTKFNQYVLYNLATAQLEANLFEDAQKTVDEINSGLMDKHNRLKVSFLKAHIYLKRSSPLEAARELLQASKGLPETDLKENRPAINPLLEQCLSNIHNQTLEEKLYYEFEDSPISDVVLFRLGSQELAVGNTGNGEAYLRSLMQRFPQSSYFPQASQLLTGGQIQAEVDSTTVGVLLPLKGKFGKFGMKSLQGIQLAFKIFDAESPDSKLSIVVEDSGEDAEQAVKALNRLVLKYHVVGVIGPMLSKGVDQVSQRAKELGVPLISLARKMPAVSTDYVFQAGVTFQTQADEIARYAVKQMGLKKFAMVFPSDKLNWEVSMNFWNAVEGFGGEIVGVETYNPGETDFRHAVDRLSGLFYQEARQRELDFLAQQRELNKITKKNRKNEQFYKLTPIVDYEAVFIPDEPKLAGQIIPTFAYRDIENVKFLGTSSWYSPEFLSRVQGYGDSCRFVDAFFQESQAPEVQKFVTAYRNEFKQEPTSLEAIAYDAALVIESILANETTPISRAALKDSLKKVRNFQGVTGKISYKDNQFIRELRVLSVKSNKFIEVP